MNIGTGVSKDVLVIDLLLSNANLWLSWTRANQLPPLVKVYQIPIRIPDPKTGESEGDFAKSCAGLSFQLRLSYGTLCF